MNARNLEIKAINEAVLKGNYVVTGVLNSGEVTIALITDLDKRFVREVLESDANDEYKLRMTKKLMKIKNRPAQEIMQVYEQKCDLNYQRCKKNNLRIR